ncbi:MAG TPA: hypothetical protein P5120_16235 [Spirochaetota bacterium]|nr:hypothetical protein [Spirochaetota bacterium]HPF08049.1 hypothetical protein [Spirochaetota bacterium]HPJ43377.1 hypothetical protein [Spirochaetota bacterium]HPR37529.1 hypothetical protein [Spirochaetota bacterium]HRX49069.1 hypothetical protein [Spirochaetota bacterium]
MRRIKSVIIAITAVLLTILSMANLHTVTIKLLVTEINLPLILIILMMLISGFFTGYILKSIIDYRRNK